MTEKRTPYGDPKLIRLIPKPPQLDGDHLPYGKDKEKKAEIIQLKSFINRK